MHSVMAALRSLTLPYGVTSGERIELDGVNGEIRIYDSSDNLLMKIDGEFGVTGYDTDGNERIRLSSPFGGQYSAIQMWTAAATETEQGIISLIDRSERGLNRMVIGPGERDDNGSVELTLCSQGGDVVGVGQAALFQIGVRTLNGLLRPYIDFTGAEAVNELAKPYTVVHDLWQGVGNVYGDGPTVDHNYGRGSKPTWKFEKTTDTILSTVSGTYTSIITTGNLALKAGRLYQITAIPGTYLLTTGSGWAVGDTWRIRIYRSIGGAAAATMRRSQALRSNVAAGAVINVAPMIGWFSPAVDSNVSFIFEAARTAGAATVTSSFSVDGGEGYGELVVQDIGAWTAGALH